ncbi:MAG: hypothetical protein IJ115_08555 [Erysipelotrichaceae bacterium]|nr:hypothetical protein [Erysipelotrichaceae bacterium]
MKKHIYQVILMATFVVAITITVIQADEFQSDIFNSAFADKKYGNCTVTTVTTTYSWESRNDDDLHWVVDVPSTTYEEYVVDQTAQEEISHYETVHHDAVTHEEPIYSTRVKHTFTYFVYYDTYAETETYVAYDLTDAEVEDFYSYHEVSDHQTENERYVSGYNTVVDQNAYDEEVLVIDQYAHDEVGHYETIVTPEEGHYEMNENIEYGRNNGIFNSEVTTTVEKN